VTTFRLASEADDALIRSILRQYGMPTWVEMAVEREPSFFAGKNISGVDWAVIAEEEGRVVGMYTAAIMPVYVNGRPEQLGYLGGLRVTPDHRHRIRYLRDGYASIGPLAPATGSLPWWFTVVAAENHAARRLLEAGVPGLPRYQFQGEHSTFGLPAARGRRMGLWRQAVEADLPRLMEFHNAQSARFQFAPVLHERLVRRIGLERFFLYEDTEDLQGAGALWDQRAFKQLVARRYRKPIGALIPTYNLYAKLFRRIPLPRVGHALDQTFIAFLALTDRALPHAGELLEDLLSHCHTPVASLGLHAAHPLATAVGRLKPMRYPARVYAVSFEGKPTLDDCPVQPEVALL
jgi:hypothetical protein